MADTGSFYDSMWGRFGNLQTLSPAVRHRHRLIEARVARRLGGDGGRLLDVGCGPGHLLERLARRFPNAELCGCDVSSISLAMARARGSAYDLFQLDLLAEEFTGWYHLGRYDVVVCSEVIEHLPDDLLALQRLRWLLGDEGQLIVTVPGGKRSRFDERIGHQRHYTRRTLATLLVEAHLTPLEIIEWGFPFHNAYRTAVRTASRLAFPPEPASEANGVQQSWTEFAELHGPGAARERRRRSEPNPEPAETLSPALQTLYALTAHALRPLYHLNAPFWGEQLIAVARL
jgi:2-polyprenyl-3-methyl-5-hydroxy-6-metoxy-1,4-benzoquinol methylase